MWRIDVQRIKAKHLVIRRGRQKRVGDEIAIDVDGATLLLRYKGELFAFGIVNIFVE